MRSHAATICLLGSGADPMAAIRSYLTRAILKLRTSTLLAQLDGLFGTALVLTKSTFFWC